MSEKQQLEFELSQQQASSLLHWFEMDRRQFMKVLGGGMLVCVAVKTGQTQESGGGFSRHQLPQDIAAWLYIAEDGRVTAFTGKVEMGQNIRTSLAQQVAEELRVPFDSVTMLMGDTSKTPWDAGTFGSRTTPTMGKQLRTTAVAAREALIAMAAQRWNTEPSALVAADGRITDPRSKQTVSYGELTRGQQLVKVAGDPPLTPASEWSIAGKPIPKVNGRQFVTGKHQYTSDMHLPGMLYGKVLRPAGFRATLISVKTEEVKNIPGATVVRDGDFIGVTAPDAWTAEHALMALTAQWSTPTQPSNRELFEYLKKNLDASQSSEPHVIGSFESAMASAEVKISQTYTVQYIAHTPLEPRAAVAEWKDGTLSVWTGSQRPFAVRDELAETFHIPAEKVRVIVPDTGSAYGGKHTGDAAVEAARLAKAAGKPVKLVWTREEEFTWAYFRPAGVIEASSGASRDGRIVAWEFHNYNSGPAAINTPYDIPNQRIQYHAVHSPLRQGSYRALAATANHFARESHMDELASAVGRDSLEFRLKHISDLRLRAVFEAAAEKFGWGKQKPSPELGVGIAGGFEKGGYVATCAEVTIDAETRVPRIRRVVEAFDCGAVVNPEGLRNQIAGAMVQGIGGALFEAVEFADGRILNPHLGGYRLPRFKDVPQIEVVILDHKDQASMGAGETPIVGIAPAVGNAIFSATGVRLRGLPLAPSGIPVQVSG